MSNEITPALTPATPATKNEVRIWVDRDDDANRVSAVLEALGYTVLRELEEGDGPARLRWAVNRLARRHKLTPREQDILERVLAGRNNEEIGKDLEISRATVKWHMHNIFAKTNTGNRESLLRLALQLGGAREQDGDAGNVEEDAPTMTEAERATEPHKASGQDGNNGQNGNNGKAHDKPTIIPAAAVPSKSWF